jgi:hypothetical protein
MRGPESLTGGPGGVAALPSVSKILCVQNSTQKAARGFTIAHAHFQLWNRNGAVGGDRTRDLPLLVRRAFTQLRTMDCPFANRP